MILLKFNGVNIYEEYQIVLENFVIGMPKPKLVKVSIPGRDGELDMSEALNGFINYSNREIAVQLGITGSEEQCEEKRNKLIGLVAGKNVKVEFSHLQGYFYGRCTVSEVVRDKLHYLINVSISAEPYRYNRDDTVINTVLSETEQNVLCRNLFMPVSPVIETTSSANIKFMDSVYSVEAGEHKLGFYFVSGVNTLRVSGSGNMTIRYREGVL